MTHTETLKLINDHREQWDLPEVVLGEAEAQAELARIEEEAQFGNNPFEVMT